MLEESEAALLQKQRHQHMFSGTGQLGDFNTASQVGVNEPCTQEH